MKAWEREHIKEHHPIGSGVIVRGNYSDCSYRVEITGDSDDGWWIQGRLWDRDKRKICTRSTGWFHKLGERDGNEIMVLDPKRPDDRVIVEEEKIPNRDQLEFQWG